MTSAERPTLAPEDDSRLKELAQACKAATRAVALYPAAHPAIRVSLGRIVEITSAAALPGPLRLKVLPDTILLDGLAPARADASIRELAGILHGHLIGEITVKPGGGVEQWRKFLGLLGRAPESVRAEGGIARVWTTTMAGRHIELREIDYTEILRERPAGLSRTLTESPWEAIVASCLQGDALDFDDKALQAFLVTMEDEKQVEDMIAEFDGRTDPTAGFTGVKSAALLRMLHRIIELIQKSKPELLDPILRNMASAVGQLSPEVILELLSDTGESTEGPRLVNAIVDRMSDRTIARFVASNVIADGTPTDRLAQAFQSLVKDNDQRQRLLALAKDSVAASPLGSTEGFESVWMHVSEKLLRSYKDDRYISDTYGRELTTARTKAIEIEQTNDDPPERIGAWLSTVATTAVRALDITLLNDLLRVEDHDDRWGELLTPVVQLLEDLFLVGDFEAAERLVSIIAAASGQGGSKVRRQHALIAIDMLVAGSMLYHIVAHLAMMDDTMYERVKVMCLEIGEVLVKPMVEALSVEARGRTRDRLTGIILAFGTISRRQVERFKNSKDKAVRRTAIYLLRQFGGSSEVPELAELLDLDSEVQREAVEAVLTIATERAYLVLEEALSTGEREPRDVLMKVLGGIRDERIVPLYAHMLLHLKRRGPQLAIYRRTIELLGALRDPHAIPPLREALFRGEWWSPFRTRELRTLAAASLARIGTNEAIDVLEQASLTGPRLVRMAARTQANTWRRRAARSTPA